MPRITMMQAVRAQVVIMRKLDEDIEFYRIWHHNDAMRTQAVESIKDWLGLLVYNCSARYQEVNCKCK